MSRLLSGVMLGAGMVLFARAVSAANDLTVLEARVDPPTLLTLGVQVLIADDDDRDATVTVRYRAEGAATWREGLPLARSRPSVVVGATIPEGFAGSLFGLMPATRYEIELHAVDPDGLDQTFTTTGATRRVPGAPASPRPVPVAGTSALTSALDQAKPGDVITLAEGVYEGTFALHASGTAENPIVIRGATQSGVVLDGGGCTGCNVLEIYGSFVQLENLTIQHASRGLRFQGVGASDNVVRRVRIRDVTLGIGSKDGQRDFIVCDNVLEGRLAWPAVYGDDGGAHANDDGINLTGDGHVVCHNRLVGFGDSIKNEAATFVSFEVFGNDSESAYDNAIELDGALRNAVVFENRFTNSWSPISFQPVYGGPAYAIRNVVVNVVDEQQKLHSLGGTRETVGARLYNNTFVSVAHALNLQDDTTAHDFVLANNIYFGPASPEGGRTVDWSGRIDGAVIARNGFFPDGAFDFGAAGKWSSFAAYTASGVFGAGATLLDAGTFASGLSAPASYTARLSAPDATLAAASRALDRGQSLASITDGFQGAAPDLGALERGCPAPIYGVRPAGTDETNEPHGCSSAGGGTGGTGAGGASSGGGPGSGGVSGSGAAGAAGSLAGAGGAAGAPPASGGAADDDGGCGCRTAPRGRQPARALVALALALLAVRRRARYLKSQ
ncbi:MAG: hypothetical protein OZ921_20655 [Sorangiineae bacterium]|nr:hypothetical protein [Polyangiaceae bacterium]MEB2324937.1 hypothetical protein [Sorangiineae bacterium]